jgi:CRISPR-associated protein Cmr5
MIQTRAQKSLKLAEFSVREVSQQKGEVQEIYQTLCQGFPVMVRTCGLCQSIVFSADKASGDGPRAEAHKLLLLHVTAVLAVEDLVSSIRDADTVSYMLYTRQVLSAWIYFKRFSISILEETKPKRPRQTAESTKK